jgi:hypothetical protein
MDDQGSFSESQLQKKLYDMIKPYAKNEVSEADFEKIFKIIYESEIRSEYTLKQTYYP